jgi:hypothetical protein
MVLAIGASQNIGYYTTLRLLGTCSVPPDIGCLLTSMRQSAAAMLLTFYATPLASTSTRPCNRTSKLAGYASSRATLSLRKTCAGFGQRPSTRTALLT